MSVPNAIEPSARGDAPSRKIVICFTGLAIATALVFISLARALEPAPASVGEASATRVAAEQFYDAANQTLMTGVDTPLRARMATDAQIESSSPGDRVSKEAFASALGGIGSQALGVQLDIMSLTVHGHEAIALVRLSDVAGSLISVSGLDRSGVWIDRISVHNGVVTELTGGTASLRSSRAWFTGSVSHARAVVAAAVISLALKGGASIPVEAPGTLSRIVQEGSVQLALDGNATPAELFKDGAFVVDLEPGQSTTLRRGDRFTILSRTSFTMRNASHELATLQIVGLMNPSGLEPGTAVKGHHGRFSQFLLDAPDNATWEGATGGQAQMVMKQEFAVEPGMLRLGIDQIELGQDASLLPMPSASDAHQFVLLLVQGAVVVSSVDESARDVEPRLVSGPAVLVLPQHAASVQQLGALPSTLYVLRLQQLNGAIEDA